MFSESCGHAFLRAFSGCSQTVSHELGDNQGMTAMRNLPVALPLPAVPAGTPRLCTLVPRLRALRLELVEQGGGAPRHHTRIVLVDQAPAWFVVDCGDERCRHGGYDLTGDLLPRLKRERTDWKITRVCRGRVGSAPCVRQVQCAVHAEYVEP
jgi:hypothetical protein